MASATDSFINKAACGGCKGEIKFHYKSDGRESMPADPADPLELLGDLSLLRLNANQRSELRTIVRRDAEREGPESVWKSRNFRKNVILSIGHIV